MNFNYLITGSGFLAKHLIKELLKDYNINKIKIFSRAEKEQ
jgi:nucleoside-diphosphate-sugar epimerase